MKITLIPDDLIKGIQCDSTSCPVALAAQRAFPESKICVELDTIEIDGLLYNLPGEVERWIADFDDGKHADLEPIQFMIEGGYK